MIEDQRHALMIGQLSQSALHPDAPLRRIQAHKKCLRRRKFDGDFAALAAGIRGKLYPLPDGTIVFPGHGPESSFGRERRSNPYVAGT